MPKHHKKLQIQRKQLVVAGFIATIALAAIILYPLTRAATSSISAEAESGTVNGNAAKTADGAASGGQKVAFGGTPSGGGACTAPATNNKLLDQDMSDSQLPWKRNGADKVVIYFQTKGVPAAWIQYMEYGVAAWNKSECLDTRLIATCLPNTNCIPVVIGDGGGDDGNFNADESGGFTVGGDIEVLSTLSNGEKKNVMVHEMGHAVGLRHRATEHVLMEAPTYDDIFDPDETDYHNLRVLYGNQK